MKPPRILVVYKKSIYQIYVLEKRNPLFLNQVKNARALRKFKEAHEVHYLTLWKVVKTLESFKVPYRLIHRARRFDYNPFDLVISIGGDGTLFEAARGVDDQPLLGVNSDPQNSMGIFCAANQNNFEEIFEKYLQKKSKIISLQRLDLSINGKPIGVKVFNDLLIAHSNPAAMSRYKIQIGQLFEEQKSSGVWFSTAAGSTAAIKSAGGKIMALSSSLIQYKPRELYQVNRRPYRLRGGIIPKNMEVNICSYMRAGMIYLDGPHMRFPFQFGDKLSIKPAKKLNLIAALSSPRMRGGEWRAEAMRGRMREWKPEYPITASIGPSTTLYGSRSIAAAS